MQLDHLLCMSLRIDCFLVEMSNIFATKLSLDLDYDSRKRPSRVRAAAFHIPSQQAAGRL